RASSERKDTIVAEQEQTNGRLLALRGNNDQTRQTIDRLTERIRCLEDSEREGSATIQDAARRRDRDEVELDVLASQISLELGQLDTTSLADGWLRVRADDLLVEAPIELHDSPD